MRSVLEHRELRYSVLKGVYYILLQLNKAPSTDDYIAILDYNYDNLYQIENLHKFNQYCTKEEEQN